MPTRSVGTYAPPRGGGQSLGLCGLRELKVPASQSCALRQPVLVCQHEWDDPDQHIPSMGLRQGCYQLEICRDIGLGLPVAER